MVARVFVQKLKQANNKESIKDLFAEIPAVTSGFHTQKASNMESLLSL